MSGIEHPPSLLGNFHISEFGFRSSSARPIFGFVPIGRFTIWAVCWRCVSFLYWFCNCFGSYLLYLFSWLRFVTLVHLIIFFWLDMPFFSFDLLLNYFWFLVSLLFFFHSPLSVKHLVIRYIPQLCLFIDPSFPSLFFYFYYRDLLELKEIQRSLPHANQPPDIITGRPGKQFLAGVPIVLLPLLSSSPTESGSNGAQDSAMNRPCSSSDAPGRTNASGTGWGPPSIKRQAQTTPARPPFPFPPRPIPFSGPASKSTFTSAPPSSISQPLRMNFQSSNKTGSTSPPSSPTAPYPSTYSNRPSTTSTSATYPYSSFHQQRSQTQVQTQSRTSWTPPSSFSHLVPSAPIKPREKPKFEFITLLDSGGSGPSPADASDGSKGVELTTSKVRPEASLDSISKLPTEIERESERDHHDDEHDLEDHDVISVTSSCPSLCTSSCPSCSASEVDTDHENEGRPRFLKGFPVNSPLSSSPFDLNDGLPLKRKPEPKKKKEKKFILVNDMEIELDDSGSESEEEEEFVPLSGRITSTTSTGATREVTTTITTRTTSTERATTTITTTTSGGGAESPSSPQSIMAPVPVKSGSRSPSLSSSASLMTPPTTPPLVEQIPRSGSRNKSLHSPSSSPSTRGRVKKVGHVVGSSTSRERSGSTGSDTSGGGGGGATSPSPSRTAMTGMCLPVKFKSKKSQEAAAATAGVRG